MYHPELMPELAKNNPQPSNFQTEKPVVFRRKRNPVVLKAKVVANAQRVEIKNMTPELFKFHGGAIYESYDMQKASEFQYELHSVFKKHLSAER